MRAAARRLLDDLARGDPVSDLVRSGTRVDVGSWLGRARVWTGCVPDALLLLAAGPRPYAQRIPLSDLGESRYNHVTGELVLAPAEGADIRALKIPPLEALRVLDAIQGQLCSHESREIVRGESLSPPGGEER
jgi:hypothetical protein